MLRSRAEGDEDAFFSIALQVAAAEARQGRRETAQEMRAEIDKARARNLRGASVAIPFSSPRGSLEGLLEMRSPRYKMKDVVLNERLIARFADIIRHLATIERYMYAENAQLKPSRYPGHGKELADGPENVLAFFNRMHQESMAIFSSLSADDLQKKCVTPGNISITAWKWLRAMIEHEVHHRAQIYIYLGMLGIATPPIYGLTSEEVKERSR